MPSTALVKSYRKNPVVVQAVRFEAPSQASVICDWCGGSNENSPNAIDITTLEGVMRADLGDWIIKGIKGEFYPCKDDVFQGSYSSVEDDSDARC